MAATVIFSFDCEGKWGVADSLSPATHTALANDRLGEAYRKLVALLDQYQVPATFAFVGLFAEPAAELRNMRHPLDQMARLSPDYLAPALADARDGSRQGWHGDWAVDLVGSSRTSHELAFHGATHIPWDTMSDALLEQEIALYHSLTSPIGRSKTMVFPRNRVAHLDAVRSLGIGAYRLGLDRPRAINLLDEFNPLPKAQFSCSAVDGLIAIPAGYFVNWRHGLRRSIPRAWSRLRAQWLIERAARSGAVVHFWLHPENIARAPATLDSLEDILRLVRQSRDNGRGEVQTQIDYCRGLALQTGGRQPGCERMARRVPRSI